MSQDDYSRLSITVETEAVPWVGIGIGDQMIEGENGVFRVAFDKRHILFWQVTGNPGTEYTITLRPERGELSINGKHPIKSKISASERMGGGHRYFTIKRP